MAASAKLNFSGKKVYLTQNGLNQAKQELRYLRETKREELADRIEQAISFGNLDESAEYAALLEEQSLIEKRISELEITVSRAVIIRQNNILGDYVSLGNTVVLEMERKVEEFTIVGRVEANPAKKMISNESPVGSALLGAKVGEVIEVITPSYKYRCKVLEIK